MTLEGWLLLEKDNVVLDFHAGHRRAGRTLIPYSAIERAETLHLKEPSGFFGRLRPAGSIVRLLRFDRFGNTQDLKLDSNKMFIPEFEVNRFNEICQEVMERAASALSPKASNQSKVASGMYKMDGEGNATLIRGDRDERAAVSFFRFSLGATTIATPSGVYSLAKVHAAVDVESSTTPATQRTTATRVAVGGLLAGSTGAVVGAVAKKTIAGATTRRVLLKITGPSFSLQEDIAPSHEISARAFAAEVNSRARHCRSS